MDFYEDNFAMQLCQTELEKLTEFVNDNKVLQVSELIVEALSVQECMVSTSTSSVIEMLEVLLELVTGGVNRATSRTNDRLRAWDDASQEDKQSLKETLHAIADYLLLKEPLHECSNDQISFLSTIAKDFVTMNFIMDNFSNCRSEIIDMLDSSYDMMYFSNSLPIDLSSSGLTPFIIEFERKVHWIMQKVITYTPPQKLLNLNISSTLAWHLSQSLYKFFIYKAEMTGEVDEYLLTPHVEFASASKWSRLWRKVDRKRSLECMYELTENIVCVCKEVITLDSNFAILDFCKHLLCEPCARENMSRNHLGVRQCPICKVSSRNYLFSRLFEKLKTLMKKRKYEFPQGGPTARGDNPLQDPAADGIYGACKRIRYDLES